MGARVRRSRFNAFTARSLSGPSMAAALAIAATACPLAARADEVRLASGEVLIVKILSVTDTTITFQHGVLGEMTLSKEVASILVREGEPAAAAPAVVEAQPAEATSQPQGAAAEAPPVDPGPPDESELSFWDGWKRSVLVGVSGSEGNTEKLNLRVGLGAKRTTTAMETSINFGYNYEEDDGEETDNSGELALRNDWFFKDSPWGFFAMGKIEYDEFQEWDWRFSGFVGPSYAFIKNDRTLLRGRVGVGGSYEVGGDDEGFTPEALLGLDFEHKISERQSVFANVDYIPSLDDFPAYRIDGKAGWSVLVDPATNMSLKLGVADKYDSTPGDGFKRNDLDYFLALSWDF